MGCHKLTYCNQESTLEVNRDFFRNGLGKKWGSEKICLSGYRYGFNGMEKDDEAKGSGNHYTTYWRQYDPRLGRWMSREPKPVAWESEYASFRNNPIYYADPNGDWVKGAGFWNNVVKTDGRINAETEASKHSDGEALKVDGVWRATWTEGHHVKIGDAEFNMKEFHMVEYHKKGKRSELASAAAYMDEGLKNFFKKDPTGLGAVNTGKGSGFHTGAKVVAGLNPLWSVPNGLKVLGENAATESGLSDKVATDFYGDERTSSLDVAMAGVSVVTPFMPGNVVLRNSGDVAADGLDLSLIIMGGMNDADLFEKMKTQKSDKK